MKNKNGFTLVELLAVIAILAILVIVAMPNVINMFNDAKVNTFVTDVQKIMDTAVTEFTMDSLMNAGETIYYSSVINNELNTSKLNMDTGGKDYFIEMDRHGDFKRVVIYDKNYCYDIYTNGTNGDVSGSNSKLITSKITKSSVVLNDIMISDLDSIHAMVNKNGNTLTYEIPGCGSITIQVVPDGGKYITKDGEVLEPGDEMPKKPETGDQVILVDYEYHYNKRLNSSFDLIEDTTMNGWGVTLNSASSGKTNYQEIESYINNKPVVAISWLFSGGGGSYLKIPPAIPDTVKYMDGAFNGCIFAEQFPLIPDGVITLEKAFSVYGRLSNLSEFPVGFKIPSSVENMNGAFSDTRIVSFPDIPDSVKKIDSLFSGCSKLVNAPKISKNVESMNSVFKDCSSLMSVPSLENLSIAKDFENTFKGCTSLVDASGIVFPKQATNFQYTFENCTNMVNAPDFSKVDGSFVYDRVKVILNYVFKNCTNMTGPIHFGFSYIDGLPYNIFEGTAKPIVLYAKDGIADYYVSRYSNISKG